MTFCINYGILIVISFIFDVKNRRDGTNMKKQGKKNRIFAGIAAAVMAVSATAVGVRSYSANAADL